MKRKRTPVSAIIVKRLDTPGGNTVEEVIRNIVGILSDIRYAGDIKQLAERYGLHYLKSKRMRVRELQKWVVDNHPAVRGFHA